MQNKVKLFAFCTDIEYPHRRRQKDILHWAVIFSKRQTIGCFFSFHRYMHQTELIASTLLSTFHSIHFLTPPQNCNSDWCTPHAKETFEKTMLNFLIGLYAMPEPSIFWCPKNKPKLNDHYFYFYWLQHEFFLQPISVSLSHQLLLLFVAILEWGKNQLPALLNYNVHFVSTQFST